MDPKIESWADYWGLFDKLCLSLIDHGRGEVAATLREAQQYVNGLTDGWHEFLVRFQQVVDNNNESLNGYERDLGNCLIKMLNQSIR